MNIYQVKLDRYENFENGNNIEPVKLFIHKESYSEDEFQNFINMARKEMEDNVVSIKYLSNYLKKYGFEEVITGYFED